MGVSRTERGAQVVVILLLSHTKGYLYNLFFFSFIWGDYNGVCMDSRGGERGKYKAWISCSYSFVLS